MELPVLSRPFASRKLSLPSSLNVSPSDFPETVNIESQNDQAIIHLEYFINESIKNRKEVLGDGFSITYSQETGRIYTIILGSSAKKKNLLDALNALRNNYKDIRIQLNFELGIKISSGIYNIIKERL